MEHLPAHYYHQNVTHHLNFLLLLYTNVQANYNNGSLGEQRQKAVACLSGAQDSGIQNLELHMDGKGQFWNFG